MPLTFIRPKLIAFNGNPLTEHNRSPLSVNYERIETRQRTANGTLRGWHKGNKATWSCSWSMLPATASKTIDGYWGADDIENFYLNNNVFTLSVTRKDNGSTAHTVMFSEFSKELAKRYNDYYYDLSFSAEEV